MNAMPQLCTLEGVREWGRGQDEGGGTYEISKEEPWRVSPQV